MPNGRCVLYVPFVFETGLANSSDLVKSIVPLHLILGA